MDRPKLNKLSQDVVNQIAAGEVIERPASVLKELLDNSIDAQTTKIVVKVKNGGMDMIEVSDNGLGIPKENLAEIFDAHTTSKIKSIEDLNTLISMGFRGEALSSITSVSKVTVQSKYRDEDVAYEISYNENGKSEVKKCAREEGTLVRVEELFYSIPARKKYLKSPQTEYRKIYEMLSKYLLIYPNIHFVVEKDGKKVLDMPIVKGAKLGDITKERAKEIFSEEDSLNVFYDGSGVSIKGLSAHPSSHKAKSAKQVVFVNHRAITDRGIIRAVYEGYSRFLPFGEKISFVLGIDIKPELVDVNVHPRKEEVRFENAFRVYSAVEEAVRHTLEKALSFNNTHTEIPQNDVSVSPFNSIRQSFSSSKPASAPKQYSEISFSNKASSVRDSLLFSQEVLQNTFSSQSTESLLQGNDKETSSIRNIFQIFDKYIVIEFEDEHLWVVDQHAAAERINFEKLTNRETKSNVQTLLVPQEVKLSKEQALFIEEQKEFFEGMGFALNIKDYGIDILTTPVEFMFDIQAMFNEIFELSDDPMILKQNFDKLKQDILATIACHLSVRSGQKLDRSEMLSMYNELSECKNEYSCPHGRPAIWKMSLSDIDKNFERTY